MVRRVYRNSMLSIWENMQLLITSFPLDFVSWHLVSPPSSCFSSAVIWSVVRRCDADRASLLPTWKCHLNQTRRESCGVIGSMDPTVSVHKHQLLRSLAAHMCSKFKKNPNLNSFTAEDFQFLFVSCLTQGVFVLFFPSTSYLLYIKLCVKLSTFSNTPLTEILNIMRAKPLQLCVSLLLTAVSSVTSFFPSQCSRLFFTFNDTKA